MTAMAIYHGHFTTPDAVETLVATLGCEPHSENEGGTLLFKSEQGKLRFDRYLEGTITDNCTSLLRTDGRTILICERQEGHQGVLTRLVYTVDLLPPKDAVETPALVLTDTMPSCGLNYSSTTDHHVYPLQKAIFRKIIVDQDAGDILAEVEFGTRRITETQAQMCRDLDLRHRALPNDIAPPTRSYEIRFHFDGKRLAPTAETSAVRQIVQNQIGVQFSVIAPPH